MAVENPLYMVGFIGTSPINGPFSMAMFDYRRVIRLFFPQIPNVSTWQFLFHNLVIVMSLSNNVLSILYKPYDVLVGQ